MQTDNIALEFIAIYFLRLLVAWRYKCFQDKCINLLFGVRLLSGIFKKNRLNARGFAREFLQFGMLYRSGKSLKRRSKSSSLHSKKKFSLGGFCKLLSGIKKHSLHKSKVLHGPLIDPPSLISHNSWTDRARKSVKTSLNAGNIEESNELDKMYLYVWSFWEKFILVHLNFWQFSEKIQKHLPRIPFSLSDPVFALRRQAENSRTVVPNLFGIMDPFNDYVGGCGPL